MINIKRFVVASSVLFIASVFCLPLAMALDPAPGFVGSDRCALCHSDKADRWRTTLHSSIYRSPDPANVISDFTGEVTLSDASKGIPETTFTLDNNGGNGPFTVTVKGETFVVDRAHGGRALDRNEDPRSPGVAGHSKYIGKQRYHTKFGDNYMILPLQWNPIPNLDGNNGGWVAYHLNDWITPEGELAPNVEGQSEERRCAGCHQTGVQVEFNESTLRYDLGVIEPNIACEACHGPGEAHASTGDKTKIVNPSKLSNYEQKLDACGKCHTRVSSIQEIGGRNLGFPYNDGRAMQPGDIRADFAVSAAGFWPNGISTKHHQQTEDFAGHDGFAGSAHAAAGLTCFSCHDPHGSENEHDLVATARDNTLCLNCHSGKFPNSAAIETHSHHPASNSHSPRCVDCHMSAVQKSAVRYDIHQHNFKVLPPAITLELAQPNACAMCHRSHDGTTDTNIAAWDEPSDIAINTWLNQEFVNMFGTTHVNDWSLY